MNGNKGHCDAADEPVKPQAEARFDTPVRMGAEPREGTEAELVGTGR